MREKDGNATQDAAVAESPARAGSAASMHLLSQAVRSGQLGTADALRLQRTVGNRAVGSLVPRGGAGRRIARKGPEQREMIEKGGKIDPRLPSEAGDWVWDEFDHTLTLFTKKDGPHGGKAFRLTYPDLPLSEIEKLDPAKRYTNFEELSPLRADALEFLRVKQGEYQETEGQRSDRVGTKTTGQTLCNSFTAQVLNRLAGKEKFKTLAGLDPRQIATTNKRGGSYRTLTTHPLGPKPGDIVHYGKVSKAKTSGGLREAEFHTNMHIGVFKSAHPKPDQEGSTWTVVDGGQGRFVSRQEIRERKRTFKLEKLIVSMPKLSPTGKAIGQIKEERMCGVLSSSINDAGQEGDKLLKGWIDIDDFFGGESESTEGGANNEVFVGKQAPTP